VNASFYAPVASALGPRAAAAPTLAGGASLDCEWDHAMTVSNVQLAQQAQQQLLAGRLTRGGCAPILARRPNRDHEHLENTIDSHFFIVENDIS